MRRHAASTVAGEAPGAEVGRVGPRRVGARGRHGAPAPGRDRRGRATRRRASTTSSSVGTGGVVGHLGGAGVAHQHPVERGGDGVLGRRPPADDLGLGAGDRDVEQPQPLAGLLLLPAAAVVVPVGASATDVDAALPVVVVEQRAGRLGHEAVGDGGEVDDGVLEALARVDRHQLHGRGVGVEATGAFGAAAGPALGDLLAQPGQQGDQPVALGEGDLVERLADVAQVGEPALAADLGQHPRGQPARRWRPRPPRRRRGC